MDTPLNTLLASLVTLPAWCRLHQAVGEHLAVDPVTAAGPLGQQGRHHVGDGPDADLQGGPVGDEGPGLLGDGLVDVVGRGAGQGVGRAVRLDEHVDQVERRMVLVNSGPSEQVRGRLGLTSTTSSRSGSRPASTSSSRVAPRWSERLTVPSGPGGAAWAVITLGANRRRMGANCRNPPGTSSMLAPWASIIRSAGPKKPLR